MTLHVLPESRGRELAERLESQLARAPRARGRRLVSATVPVSPDLDPAAVAFSTRRAGERWFCWEQPDNGFALAAVGSVAEVVSRGERRFADLAGGAAALLAEHRAAGGELPPGAGPVLVGGLAFWPDGASASQWSSFPPALLSLPELSIVRASGEAHLTVNALAGAEDARAVLARVRARLAALATARPLPILDPDPLARCSVESALPPAAYEEAVDAARKLMRTTALRKVVLAREVVVRAPRAFDAAALYGVARELYPSCFAYCVGTPEGAFVGASPELLVRRRGASVWSVALAASSRRSADARVDHHLGEQLLRDPKTREEHEIVAERIVAKLRPLSVWVSRADEPEIVKVAHIQHLATPVHAQLRAAASAVEVAAVLHPTPALGGEPWERAAPVVRELEALDRGWYGAPVGWMDAADDGDFCVAIRGALLRDRVAHVLVGNGIVAASDPQAELAETEVKLETMLPLLTA